MLTRSRKIALILLLMLCVNGSAFAWTTASIVIKGNEQSSGSGWDQGSITISLNGHSETVTTGQFSTPEAIASGLAARFSEDPISAVQATPSRLCTLGVCAKAYGRKIVFQLSGTTPFETPTITDSTSSFQAVPEFGWPVPNEPVSSSVSVSCAPNSVSFGQTTSCSATVAGVSEGVVDFTVDMAGGHVQWRSATINSSGIAVVSDTFGNLPPGTYAVTANYLGNGSTLSPASNTAQVTVNAPSPGSTPIGIYTYTITDGEGNPGYAANGNIQNYYDSVNGTWSNIAYDNLNRLSGATQSPTSGAAQNFCWDYDSFGNRLHQQSSSSTATFTNVPGGSCANSGTVANNMASYNASNQITTTNASGLIFAPVYDLSGDGDITNDGVNQYLYDDDGRICAVATSAISGGVTMTQYIYDAEGNRIAKGTITSWSCDMTPDGNGNPGNGFSTTNLYVLDQQNRQWTEMDGQGKWEHTNVYAGGDLVATYDMQGLHFHLSDWLGTQRVQIDYAGNVEQTWASLPFGEFVPSRTPPLGATEQHFTGKERDAESGLDYFGKRYYGSSMGRWMSPDLVNVTEERMMNPSSTLNKYVYGANNPLKYVDPDGEDITYFYDQSGFAGHAVLFAYNQANGDSAIESFGPASKSVGYRMAEPFMPVPGTGMFDMAGVKSADDLRSTYASMTIQTTPELAQQVIDFIRANPDPSMWDVMGPNCSSEVWKILKKFKLDNQHHDHNQGMTPKMLWGDMALRYNPGIYGTNPQNGKDYGAPRSDMFNLMWLSLPQSKPREKVTVTIKTTDGQVIQ